MSSSGLPPHELSPNTGNIRFVAAKTLQTDRFPIKTAFALAISKASVQTLIHAEIYSGDDKSLARLGRKQGTATEDFEFHISYL